MTREWAWITCAHCRKTHGGGSIDLTRAWETRADQPERSHASVLEQFCSVACSEAHVPGTMRAEGVPALPAPLSAGARFQHCSACGGALAGWRTVYTLEGEASACIAALCQGCRELDA
jgi:hypothetical protein